VAFMLVNKNGDVLRNDHFWASVQEGVSRGKQNFFYLKFRLVRISPNLAQHHASVTGKFLRGQTHLPTRSHRDLQF